ncbi:hypothetical protein J437_LFUL019254 [Ladona fulva]|uniref:Uncharacterized protein n=1 Tax=Ladona fulva TaxID=123851 RepID=A0A8K0KTK1_LADFU|nr:hypothetical protein J437_LFUL019254 [Ladona fulva]
MSFPLSAPFTMTISGPTMSGKSVWMEKFIESIDALVDTKFESIIWCYSEFQSISSKIRGNPKVKFHQGVPDLSEISNGSKAQRLICLDDLMMEIDTSIVNLFTKGAHHWNLSVIFITQNLFHQGKGRRDISLNSHYIIFHLARQIHPENPLFIQDAYRDATSKPHGYLLIDLKQSTPDDYRIRTNIFPEDKYTFVYVPKNKNKRRMF